MNQTKNTADGGYHGLELSLAGQPVYNVEVGRNLMCDLALPVGLGHAGVDRSPNLRKMLQRMGASLEPRL